MNKFHGKYLVELGGIVLISFEMTPNHSLEPLSFDKGSGKSAWVEQHVLNVPSEHVPVPHAEMEELVSP